MAAKKKGNGNGEARRLVRMVSELREKLAKLEGALLGVNGHSGALANIETGIQRHEKEIEKLRKYIRHDRDNHMTPIVARLNDLAEGLAEIRGARPMRPLAVRHDPEDPDKYDIAVEK